MPSARTVKQTQPDQLHLRERDAHIRAIGTDAVGHDGRLLALDPGENVPNVSSTATA
jgi:hypothetical protein